MKNIIKFLLRKFFWGLGRHLLSDDWYAKVRYWLELDEWPDLKHPTTFTEKIQWIKLNERTAERQRIADRTKVRNFVADRIGEQYLIPLIGCYNTLDPTTWESLPSQFVLKANHGCGMLAIVFDKEEESYQEVKQQTDDWQATDYFTVGREWVYKQLPRTILAESLILTPDGDIPKDYKFFCFDGEVALIQVDYDRFGEQKRNLFDRDFNRIQGHLLYPPYEGSIQPPPNLKKAIQIAEKLSKGFTFLRVDLYLLQESIYFGELTNYPGNGFVPFQPKELELQMGQKINLDIPPN
ncbi:ATP-grasp fold amidoligase family protein [Fodinibius salsisoli]|uniref:TupA-like ATPgrasp n=1 Tax=Fodinibius salsisoli TaxID=2820877 RepID=A0ABT3PRP2_9BACT|nr:ATP-grasp fold amidoligase family protein [Fodinibius salsisoli]MCW9708535.1 hypothetical protein [Fodinibius salsisoli]